MDSEYGAIELFKVIKKIVADSRKFERCQHLCIVIDNSNRIYRPITQEVDDGLLYVGILLSDIIKSDSLTTVSIEIFSINGIMIGMNTVKGTEIFLFSDDLLEILANCINRSYDEVIYGEYFLKLSTDKYYSINGFKCVSDVYVGCCYFGELCCYYIGEERVNNFIDMIDRAFPRPMLKTIL